MARVAADDLVPEPFSSIRSYEDAFVAVNAMKPTTTILTRYPSFLSQFPDTYNKYIDQINQMRDATVAAKSAISANMISETLTNACPVVAQFYCLSKKFVTSCFNFFQQDEFSAQLAYDRYLPPNTRVEDPREIDIYNNSVNALRAYLGEHGLPESPEMRTKQGEVLATINAQGELVPLQAMLESMIGKRRTRLDAPGAGAMHLEDVKAALAGDLSGPIILPFPKAERRQAGFSFTQDAQGRFVRVPGGRALLLSSALAKDTQMRGDLKNRVEEYLRGKQPNDPNYDLLTRALLECNAMLDADDQDAGIGAGFLSQRSNIDPLWFTYYIAFRILRLSVQQFYQWQRVIYGICRRIRGKTNMEALLRHHNSVPGIAQMLLSISRSTEIHTPPWVLHSSRIYDIAAVIGACDTHVPRATIANPAVSWRYFFNINPADRGIMRFLTTLNAVERTADPQSEICQSEKILQQFILGRDSPMANTNNLTGNALNVRIIA